MFVLSTTLKYCLITDTLCNVKPSLSPIAKVAVICFQFYINCSFQICLSDNNTMKCNLYFVFQASCEAFGMRLNLKAPFSLKLSLLKLLTELYC